jgi:cobalt/nickel transport system permease protein
MHIPDGFLSTRVWATMDAVAIPAVALLSRRAQRSLDTSRLPLMGVMGAFVFAAQMINFPVGNGTSSHLVGGALLSFTLGPAAAAMVMTSILAIQALVFQDGGLLALGANVFNMAIAGVFAGYLPYLLLRGRKSGIFLGATLSLLVSAFFALTELALSGVRMPPTMLFISIALFTVSAVAEGAITVAVVGALRNIEPNLLRQTASATALTRRLRFVLAGASAALVMTAIYIASTKPDGIEEITRLTTARATSLLSSRLASRLSSPLANYQVSFLSSHSSNWLTHAFAGLAGIFAVYLVCLVLSRLLRASRSALKPEGI